MTKISPEEIRRISDNNMEMFYNYLRLESVSAEYRNIPETANAAKQIIESIGGEAQVLTLEGAHPIVYGFFQQDKGEIQEKLCSFITTMMSSPKIL